MSVDMMLALVAFALVTSITPGPSNLILLTAGARDGLRRSLRLVLAVNLSFLTMLLAVGFGLGQLLQANAVLYATLKSLSLAYILWLAWKIARSSPAARSGVDGGQRSLSFLDMAILQWVNPKAWAVALTVTVAYTTPANPTASLLLMTFVFGLVNLPAIGAWAACGTVLGRVLSKPARVRTFNLAMAALLVLSALPLFLDLAQDR